MTPEERDEALELVDEIQRDRSGSKASLQGIPHILLPYQAAWHRDMATVRTCEKGRRIGFSWGAWAAEAALEAARTDGMSQYYMGYNQGMAAEFIGDCAFFAKAYQSACSKIDVGLERVIIDNEKRDIVRYKIEFSSGHKIEALSSMPHNWRGRQGHARIDEAAFHQNLSEVVKGALAYRLWGGRISLGSTHDGEDNEFNLLIRDVRAGKLKWSLHKTDFDTALKQGLFKRICLVTGKTWSPEAEETFRADAYADYPDQDDADEELGCIPKRGSGAYFTRIVMEQCQVEGIPTLRFSQAADFVTNPRRKKITEDWLRDHVKPLIDAMPTDRRTVAGQDFGRSGDLSVIWPLQEDKGVAWRMPFLIELRNIPFDCQQIILHYVLDELPLFHHIKMDARGNGQQLAEATMQEFGEHKVECVMLSAGWYAEHFPRYRTAYEDRTIVIAQSEDIIADHRMVQLVNGSPRMSDKKNKGSDGKQRHGDTAVAGCLAWAATLDDTPAPAGATHEHDPDAYRPQSAFRESRPLFGRNKWYR